MRKITWIKLASLSTLSFIGLGVNAQLSWAYEPWISSRYAEMGIIPYQRCYLSPQAYNFAQAVDLSQSSELPRLSFMPFSLDGKTTRFHFLSDHKKNLFFLHCISQRLNLLFEMDVTLDSNGENFYFGDTLPLSASLSFENLHTHSVPFILGDYQGKIEGQNILLLKMDQKGSQEREKLVLQMHSLGGMAENPQKKDSGYQIRIHSIAGASLSKDTFVRDDSEIISQLTEPALQQIPTVSLPSPVSPSTQIVTTFNPPPSFGSTDSFSPPPSFGSLPSLIPAFIAAPDRRAPDPRDEVASNPAEDDEPLVKIRGTERNNSQKEVEEKKRLLDYPF